MISKILEYQLYDLWNLNCKRELKSFLSVQINKGKIAQVNNMSSLLLLQVECRYTLEKKCSHLIRTRAQVEIGNILVSLS